MLYLIDYGFGGVRSDQGDVSVAAFGSSVRGLLGILVAEIGEALFNRIYASIS